MLVPLEEAEGRAARTCVTIYPPGVPMLMPGERIGTREIARIREDWKLGLTVEGICEKSDKLKFVDRGCYLAGSHICHKKQRKIGFIYTMECV